MGIQQSQLRRKIRKKDFKSIGKSKTNKLWLLALIPIPLPKKKGVTLVKLHVSTRIKKTTMPATILSQKTSIDFNNFWTND